MKLQIKQYEYIQKEIGSIEVNLPTETSYYFQTGIRRSIKITPKYTTWNKEFHNKEEELYEYDIVYVYGSSECKVEKVSIGVRKIEEIYYSEKHEHKRLIVALISDDLLVRTKEQFEEDLNDVLTQINK